jgi:hypothetical protein
MVRGFVCWENLYIFNGSAFAIPGDDGDTEFWSGKNIEMLEFMDGEDARDRYRWADPDTVAAMNDAEVEEGAAGLLMFCRMVGHMSHFFEVLAGWTMLQNWFDMPRATHMVAGLVPFTGPDSWRGIGGGLGMNFLPVAAMNPGLRGSALWDWTAAGAGTGGGGNSTTHPARMLHLRRACAVDRDAAHRHSLARAHNNINAPSMPFRKPEFTSRLVTRMKSFPLIRHASLDFADLYGQNVAEAVSRPSSDGPLVVVVQRNAHRRRFNEQSFDELVAYVKRSSGSKRVVAVAFEPMAGPAQLKLALHTDIMIGAHGTGMYHLLWMPLPGSVFLIFPHTGWENGESFLSRARGLSYSPFDAVTGPQNPVNHGVADLAHQLHTSNITVNMALAEPALDRMFARYRELRTAVDRGGIQAVNWTGPGIWSEFYTGEEQFAKR